MSNTRDDITNGETAVVSYQEARAALKTIVLTLVYFKGLIIRKMLIRRVLISHRIGLKKRKENSPRTL